MPSGPAAGGPPWVLSGEISLSSRNDRSSRGCWWIGMFRRDTAGMVVLTGYGVGVHRMVQPARDDRRRNDGQCYGASRCQVGRLEVVHGTADAVPATGSRSTCARGLPCASGAIPRIDASSGAHSNAGQHTGGMTCE